MPGALPRRRRATWLRAAPPTTAKPPTPTRSRAHCGAWGVLERRRSQACGRARGRHRGGRAVVIEEVQAGAADSGGRTPFRPDMLFRSRHPASTSPMPIALGTFQACSVEAGGEEARRAISVARRRCSQDRRPLKAQSEGVQARTLHGQSDHYRSGTIVPISIRSQCGAVDCRFNAPGRVLHRSGRKLLLAAA